MGILLIFKLYKYFLINRRSRSSRRLHEIIIDRTRDTFLQQNLLRGKIYGSIMGHIKPW